MSRLDEEARAWEQENSVPPRENPNAPGSTATPQPPPPAAERAAEAEEDEDDAEAITPEQAAAFGIGLLDTLLTNFVGQRMAFTDKQERKLVKLGAPLVQKYFPDAGAVVSPEVAFVGTLGVICIKNYLSPEPGQPEVPPAGGAESKPGTSGGSSVSTEANVDGRDVHAEVLQ